MVEFDGLIKWSVLQKDEKINRHVMYTEENFPCLPGSNENKEEFKHREYGKFFKMAGEVYADITKRWLKLGNVEIFYKDRFGDEIVINNEKAFSCFLRNVAEILKSPIEIIIKDYVEITSNEAICEECGIEKICLRCKKIELQNDSKIPETPESLVTNLEATLNGLEQKVKSWTPEKASEAEVAAETPDEIEIVANVVRKGSQESEWSSDFSLERPKSQNVETQNGLNEQFDQKNFEFKKDYSTPEPITNVPETIYVTSEHQNTKENKENVELDDNYADNNNERDLESLNQTENSEKISLTPLEDNFDKALTITEQVIEEPVVPEFGVPNAFTQRRRSQVSQEFSDSEKGPSPNPFHQIKNKNIRRPRPGYIDFDRPTQEDDFSYDFANWKSDSPLANRIKKVNDIIGKPQVIEKKEETKIEMKKTEAFVKEKSESPQPSETSSTKIRIIRKVIAPPRPLRISTFN